MQGDMALQVGFRDVVVKDFGPETVESTS